ncbi:MAG: hypothetical protein ACPGXL_10050 [Chitinophagales bacterium]
MQNSKLVETIRTFSHKQRERFKDFLNSPFFNKNEKLVQFYTYLLRYAPTFSHKNLAKQVVFMHIFPDKKFNDLKLRHLMSDLLKMLERFITHTTLETNDVEIGLKLISYYNDNGLNRHVNDNLKSTRKTNRKSPYRNAQFFYNQFSIEREEATFLSTSGGRTGNFNLQETVNELDRFYMIQKLALSCTKVNLTNNAATQFDSFLLEEIIQLVESQKFEETPALQIYYHAYLMLKEEDTERHFTAFKELIVEHSDLFPFEEAIGLYTYAKNFCIWNINAGKQTYYDELFELYQSEVTRQSHESNVVGITPGNFKNIVTVGLRLGKFDWVKQFIEDHKENIDATYPQDVANYNMAQVFFYQEDYDSAIDLLGQKYDDPFFEIDSRKLLIKIFYETQEWIVLDNVLNTLRVFIHRNRKIANRYKSSNRNFLNILFKITKARDKARSKGKVVYDKIEKLINETSLLAERKWLLEKLKELRSKD